MPKTIILVASTRPGRIGSTIGGWVAEEAEKHGGFEVELVELADMKLPVFDEPNHPMSGVYIHQHTKDWSAKVASVNAFVFVTPEYDYSAPPSLTNALIYLHREWAYKPVGIVSYGGLSGGTRSAQMAKQTITALRMMPIPDGVILPMVHGLLDENKVFVAQETHKSAAKKMFDELNRWASALAHLQNQ